MENDSRSMDDGDATYMGMSRRELLAGLAVAGAGAAALSGMAGSAEAAPIDTASSPVDFM